MVVPGKMYSWMTGKSVSASRQSTATKKQLLVLVSSPPNTHCIHTQWPTLCLHLTKADSSISKTWPYPPMHCRCATKYSEYMSCTYCVQLVMALLARWHSCCKFFIIAVPYVQLYSTLMTVAKVNFEFSKNVLHLIGTSYQQCAQLQHHLTAFTHLASGLWHIGELHMGHSWWMKSSTWILSHQILSGVMLVTANMSHRFIFATGWYKLKFIIQQTTGYQSVILLLFISMPVFCLTSC